MKKPPTLNILKVSALLTVTALLASCAVPDPKFLAHAGDVRNVDYPENKIVGTWAHVSIMPVRTTQIELESKSYLEIRPGGTGRKREVSTNKLTGGYLAAEGNFRWAKTGRNQWRISLPGTAAYRVTDSYLMAQDKSITKPPVDIYLSYHNEELYDFSTKRVLVRATPANVTQLANRMRSQTVVLDFERNIPTNRRITRPQAFNRTQSRIPYARSVPGKPGFVVSPYGGSGYIDVRGFPSGAEVNDPYSGSSFLVP